MIRSALKWIAAIAVGVVAFLILWHNSAPKM